ncbi:MAG: response regulator [Pelosinus sp.]|nr:response regulator [Pelosinus sp.]
MRILIAEDDLASRKYLYKIMSAYGECDLTVNGLEVVEAFLTAWDLGHPYDLICLDIMMPRVDGIKALQAIRDLERQKKVKDEARAKVIMITALNDKETVFNSFETGCEAFAAKPVDTAKLLEVMRELGLKV